MKRTVVPLVVFLVGADRVVQLLPMRLALVALVAGLAGLVLPALFGAWRLRRTPADAKIFADPEPWVDCPANLANGGARYHCCESAGHEGPHEASSVRW